MKPWPVLLAIVGCASFSKGFYGEPSGDVSGRDLATPEYELSVPATLCARRETGDTTMITVHEGRCDGIPLFQIAVTNPRLARKLDPRYTTIRNERRDLRGVPATDLLRRDEATGSYSRDLSFFTTDDLVVLNDPAQRYGVVHLFYEGLDDQRRKAADDVIDGVVPFRTPLDRVPRR
jgi:hypothetical protein